MPTDPPRGLVTIMFTDIVGSTAIRDALVKEHGEVEGDDLYRKSVLDLHNAKIRPILASHGGFEVKTNEVLWHEGQQPRPPQRDDLPYPWITPWVGRRGVMERLAGSSGRRRSSFVETAKQVRHVNVSSINLCTCADVSELLACHEFGARMSRR